MPAYRLRKRAPSLATLLPIFPQYFVLAPLHTSGAKAHPLCAKAHPLCAKAHPRLRTRRTCWVRNALAVYRYSRGLFGFLGKFL